MGMPIHFNPAKRRMPEYCVLPYCVVRYWRFTLTHRLERRNTWRMSNSDH
jgi:hypothetical protein